LGEQSGKHEGPLQGQPDGRRKFTRKPFTLSETQEGYKKKKTDGRNKDYGKLWGATRRGRKGGLGN